MPETSADDPCAFPATEADLLTCRQNDHSRVEASIQELVERLSKTYGSEPDLAATFAKAQAKWQEFREAECKLRTYDSRDGTAFESYWLECLTKLDIERVNALKYMEDHP